MGPQKRKRALIIKIWSHLPWQCPTVWSCLSGAAWPILLSWVPEALPQRPPPGAHPFAAPSLAGSSRRHERAAPPSEPRKENELGPEFQEMGPWVTPTSHCGSPLTAQESGCALQPRRLRGPRAPRDDCQSHPRAS